jgi:2-oxoglutarate dehydrogenase E2 component (dihydrolipoamide succinyltransferase)
VTAATGASAGIAAGGGMGAGGVGAGPGAAGAGAGGAAGGAVPVASAGAGTRLPGALKSALGAISPAVRRLLAEHGLDAASIAGSGEGGRITVEDVLSAAASGSVIPAAAASASSAAGVGAEGEPSPRIVPHSAVRKRIAEHMVQSLLRTAPHVTTVFEADMTAVLRHRARQRAEFEQRGVPLTLTAYFVQAVVAAIRVVPEANSRWTDTALEIYDTIHVGIATAVEGTGLLVPVLRDAGTRSLLETAGGLDDLVTRARTGRLEPADMRGGTFTLSNHGVSGSLLAAPIVIHQPQSAILGIGRLEKRAVVVDEGDEEKIAVRPRCYVTLTIDHRVLDGHQANRFMQAFVQTINDWPV